MNDTLNRVPLHEQYKRAGDEWADLAAAATLLEDTISLRRSQRQLALLEADPKMAVNKSELIVKADKQSIDDVQEAVEKRKAANKARVYLDSIKMQHSTEMNDEATHRMEVRLTP